MNDLNCTNKNLIKQNKTSIDNIFDAIVEDVVKIVAALVTNYIMVMNDVVANDMVMSDIMVMNDVVVNDMVMTW